MEKKIAIIGGGISGISLADHLKDLASIQIFEKSRGIGGRMSTRYTDDFQFDHGAQFFTARSEKFQKFLEPFIKRDIVNEWLPKIFTLEVGEKPFKRDWLEPHYTAVPKMNTLCKTIAVKHDVYLKIEIASISQEPAGWFLIDSDNGRHGPFDWVISSAPAPQSAKLLPSYFKHYDDISAIKMQGCYSLMIGLPDDLNLDWQVAKIKNSPIVWMAVNSSKPLCDTGYSLLIQTSNKWAQSHIDDDQDEVKSFLLAEVEKLLQKDLCNIDYISLHRWRYANTIVDDNQENQGHLLDEINNLAACGDWCIKGGVESAYLSALSLAKALKKYL
jgi:renalase